MTEPTASETTLIKTRPHRTKLWLSIYQPSTVFAAQVTGLTGSGGQGYISIPYDNLSTGSAASVNDGMTMFVGTTPGASDKGRIRVKSVVTGTVNVAENSYIDWDDNDYLTIVNFYEINSRYPRIIQDPDDPTKTIWYKDYDIEYTNQNTVQGAFPCMGSHFAGFIENDTGFCNVWYTSTGTAHVVNGVTLSYYWTFEGATTPTSNSSVPGWISYNTPGHYTTELIVSGSNGSVDKSYRHISIYNRPETSTNNVPVLKWELDKLAGSHESGGYTASIRILQDIPENLIRDGSLIVIYSDNWYGSTKQSIGGNSEHRQSILFTGYILNGTIRFNAKFKEITFDVGSPTEIMKKCDSFSISVEDIDDPVAEYTSKPDYYVSPWTLLERMNVKKAIHHYLKWHSTILLCCDFHFIGTDQLIQYFDADRTNLYSAIQTLMKGALYGYWGSDRQGGLWAETEYYTDAPRNRNLFFMSNEDWIGDPTIEEVLMNEVSYLEAGGINYLGFTGTSIPLLAAAPGISPGYKGSIQRFQGLALSSQSQLNNLVGSVYSYMNRKYPRISFDMAGNYSFFDISPEEEFAIVIPPEKNPRGQEINIGAFINQVSFSYNSKSEALITRIDCSHIPSPIIASTLPIPPIPPTSGKGVGFKIPPISIPPINIGGGGTEFNQFVPPLGGVVGGAGYGIYLGMESIVAGTVDINHCAVVGIPLPTDLLIPSDYARVHGALGVPNGASTVRLVPYLYAGVSDMSKRTVCGFNIGYSWNAMGTLLTPGVILHPTCTTITFPSGLSIFETYLAEEVTLNLTVSNGGFFYVTFGIDNNTASGLDYVSIFGWRATFS